eukprot:jgi/Bigna1/86468/estExt_fgenesh1_pg.C_100318
MEAGRRGIYHNEGSGTKGYHGKDTDRSKLAAPYETKSRLQGEAYLGSNVRDQARAAVPQQSFEGAPPPPLPRHITNETASISLVSQKRSNNLESFWNFHGHQKQPFKVDRRSHHNANSSSSSDSVSDRDGIKQQRSNQKGRAARTADDEKQKKKKKEERTTCTTHLSTYLPSLGQHRMWVQVTNVGHSGIFLESFWKCPGDSRIFSGSAPVSQKNSFLEAHWCRSKKINFLDKSQFVPKWWHLAQSGKNFSCRFRSAPCPWHLAQLQAWEFCASAQSFWASGGAMFGRQNIANHSDSETFGNGVHVQHRAKVLSPWQKWHVHISTLIVVTTSMGACQRSGRATHDQGAVAACARPLVLHAALRTCAWKFSELPESSRTFRKLREPSRNTRENSREFWKIRESSRMRRNPMRTCVQRKSQVIIRIQKHTRPRVDFPTSTAQSRAQKPNSYR